MRPAEVRPGAAATPAATSISVEELRPEEDLRAPAILLIFGLLLNQSGIMFGLNMSLADPLALLLLLAALIRGKLWIPFRPLLFFVILSLVGLGTSLWVSQFLLPGQLATGTILTDYLKLLTSFAYFALGIHLVRLGIASSVLRAFAIGAIAVSLLAVLSLVFPPIMGHPVLFYAWYRFRGIMYDPNLYSIVAIAALAVTWHDTKMPRALRGAGMITLATAALLSGSKTGAVVLALWVGWRIVTHLRSAGQSGPGGALYLLGAGLVALVVAVLIGGPAAQSWIASAAGSNRALERAFSMFDGLETGAQGSDESARELTWTNALRLIEQHPVTGVGIGTYGEVAYSVTSARVLAHNTFLQLAAEWGIPLAGVFFAWVFWQLFRVPPLGAPAHSWATSRAIVAVLLAGSLAISLNNARIFWLALGILAAINAGTHGAGADPPSKALIR
ncbi:MAG TPA: O-antigen ligase family protein [Actinomycetaceae bacterium]|nr:O-antigen ligase family protein [Actinomycetaceae bacterium]